MYNEVSYYIPRSLEARLYCDLVIEYLRYPGIRYPQPGSLRAPSPLGAVTLTPRGRRHRGQGGSTKLNCASGKVRRSISCLHRHLDGKAPWKYLALFPECRPAARVTSRTLVPPFPTEPYLHVQRGSAGRARPASPHTQCPPRAPGHGGAGSSLSRQQS